MLSFPVPRWKFLLEKLLAIITLSATFPFLVWGSVVVGVEVLNMNPDIEPVVFKSEAFLIAILGKWLVYVVFTIITILCSVIFMETTKTLGSAGLIVGGSWTFERFGGLIRTASTEVADVIQGVSLFHYLDGATVLKAMMKSEPYPVAELGLVLLVGILALTASLVLFWRREFK
jgi:ABC-type transport system involved in multi-copper enzyme maturation permease subunit